MFSTITAYLALAGEAAASILRAAPGAIMRGLKALLIAAAAAIVLADIASIAVLAVLR